MLLEGSGAGQDGRRRRGRALPVFVVLVTAMLALAGRVVQAQAPAQPAAESPKFDIAGFRVEGNTVLKSNELNQALAPHVGKQRDFADVQRALESLQAAYQKRGYGAVYVFLPEQKLESGRIVLRVVEARVGLVVVTGNQYFSTESILRDLPDLKAGAVPNVVDIAENSRAANENPARQVQVVLKPAQGEGKVDALVEVRDQPPFRPFVSLDNTGTEATGHYRLGGGAQHANLWDRAHVATLQYITSPTDFKAVKVFSLGYRVPIPSTGDSTDAYIGYSDVNAASNDASAAPIAISGQGALAGARYNLNMRRSGEYEHRVLFGLDWRKYQNQCSIGAFGPGSCATSGGNPGADVQVRPLSLGYSGQWTRTTTQFGFNLSMVRNIPGGANGDDLAFAAVRPGAKAAFSALRFGANATSPLFGTAWQLRVNLSGQQTGSVLIPAEQFGVTGFNAVRGFYEREVQGDKGYAANLELHTPDVARSFDWPSIGLRFLMFIDGGVATLIQPVATQIEREVVSSWGLGMRMTYKKDATLRLDAARVVQPGGSREQGQSMVHFGLVWMF